MRSFYNYFLILFLLTVTGCAKLDYITTNATCGVDDKGALIKNTGNADSYKWFYAPFFSPLPSLTSSPFSTSSSIPLARTGRYNLIAEWNSLHSETHYFEVLHKIDFMHLNNVTYTSDACLNLGSSSSGSIVVKSPISTGDRVFWDFSICEGASYSYISMDISGNLNNPTFNFWASGGLMIHASCYNGAGIVSISDGANEKHIPVQYNSYVMDKCSSPNTVRRAIKIRIEKDFVNNTDVLSLYVNGSKEYSTNSVSFAQSQYLKFYLTSNGIRVSDIYTSRPCIALSALMPNYIELYKQYDGNVYTVGNTLLFKYDEKYDSDYLDYHIYNWKRDVMLSNINSSGSQSKSTPLTTHHYGVQYHQIPISSYLTDGEIYYLEVKNSKGEVYKAKFKYQHQDLGNSTNSNNSNNE